MLHVSPRYSRTLKTGCQELFLSYCHCKLPICYPSMSAILSPLSESRVDLRCVCVCEPVCVRARAQARMHARRGGSDLFPPEPNLACDVKAGRLQCLIVQYNPLWSPRTTRDTEDTGPKANHLPTRCQPPFRVCQCLSVTSPARDWMGVVVIEGRIRLS